MTFEITPGLICKLPFPLNDEAATRFRPALVLNEPDRYGDIRMAFITASYPSEGEKAMPLEARHFAETALPLESYLRLGHVFHVHRDRIVKSLTRLTDAAMAEVHRNLVADGVESFAEATYKPKRFSPGISVVPPSGKVMGAPELRKMVDASLDGWLTTGRFNTAFEKCLAEYLGAKHVLTTNSGSSANLLALAALTSPKLEDKALKPGDEIITVAAGFPTTVNPALQYGLVPVFVDIHIPTYNVDVTQLEAAISDKTRAIMLAHTLGNPFNLDEVMRIARKHDLWVIEDTCDALGTTYTPKADIPKGRRDIIPAGVARQVGTFGDIGTLSFYPAHHITMGEGGAVYTDSGKLKPLVESFRDWGRDCYCPPGEDNTCGKRFCWKLGDLPEGYDHKYTYSHIGYNLKISDMQAACALAQMDRLDGFVAARRKNFEYLSERLADLQEQLILPQPTPNSDPSWFGFPITLRPESGIQRVDLIRHLDERRIGTRLLFAGNLIRQPYMAGRQYRVHGELTNTDLVMNNTFWVGVYPGLGVQQLEFVAETLTSYLRGKRS